MSTMQSEIYDALIDAGASEPKARAAAEVIAITPKADEVATKKDLRAEIAALENRLIKWAIGIAAIIISINIATAAFMASLIK